MTVFSCRLNNRVSVYIIKSLNFTITTKSCYLKGFFYTNLLAAALVAH